MRRAKRIATKKASNEYFLDANIVMYAADAPHPLREPCRTALQRAFDRDVALQTDSEVLQEILRRYFALRKPEAAQAVYRATVDLCSDVFPVAEAHTARALELLLGKVAVSARDAIHAAVMEAHGISRILSADEHFDLMPGISRVSPPNFLA